MQVTHSWGETVEMSQAAASDDSFRMHCIIDEDTDISLWDEGEKWAQSKTSL